MACGGVWGFVLVVSGVKKQRPSRRKTPIFWANTTSSASSKSILAISPGTWILICDSYLRPKTSRPANAEITELGRRYVLADGREKEELLLQLCQNFHPYLMKYLVMICRGHVPVWKGGAINSDVAAFMGYFLAKGRKLDLFSAREVATSLHLAFKGMDGAEVYDVLMATFLEAVAKYDPAYTEKVKRVVECIEHELSTRKQIHSGELRRHLDLDCDRHLRLLARRGFLAAVKGKDGKISGWVRTSLWPPPEEFFTSGAIGFAYYLQTWFRYYLQQWIERRFGELEAGEGHPSIIVSRSIKHFFVRRTSMKTQQHQLPDNLFPLHYLLRARRRALGLTQEQIAQEMGVGAEAVSLWEKGSRRMELNKVPRLAAILRLNPKDLCRSALAEWYPSLYAALFQAPSSRPVNASSRDTVPGDTPLEPGVVVGDSLRQPEQLPQQI